MTELKPCPFCGGKMKLNSRRFYEHDRTPCLLSGFEIAERSVPFWNKRVDEDDLK